MQDGFGEAVKVILAREGGYVFHPKDPGSHTNMGITIYTLSNRRKKECGPEDVKNLSREEAEDIYRDMYWTPLSCDDLPSGVDLSVFDMGVNAGILVGARILQKLVGTPQDGVIGPKTLGAVKDYCATNGTSKLLEAYRDSRINFYKCLDAFDTFGNGWINRANIVCSESKNLVKET